MSSWEIRQGDCLDVLPTLAENSIDTVICDPPAGIAFMNKTWDSDRGGSEQWIDWLASVMVEVRRVLKPGGALLCWALPRTSHWTGTAIERAGFRIVDVVTHIFGSGFPKSHSIGKALDRAAGAEREVVGEYPWPDGGKRNTSSHQTQRQGIYSDIKTDGTLNDRSITAPATPAAKLWEGWGTGLSPAAEFWWLALQPARGDLRCQCFTLWGFWHLGRRGTDCANW